MNIEEQVLTSDKPFANALHKANIYCSRKLAKSIKKGDYTKAGFWHRELERCIRDLNKLIDRKIKHDAEFEKQYERMMSGDGIGQVLG